MNAASIFFVLVLTNPALTEKEQWEAAFNSPSACQIAAKLWVRQNVETECRPVLVGL